MIERKGLQALSRQYHVRELAESDVGIIMELCSQNPLFYQYHPPFATEKSILEDMEALPPGKGRQDKYYMGFFLFGELIAVLDLILSYPQEKCAYFGFFMMNQRYQGKGIGSEIIRGCCDALAAWGMDRIRLAVDRGNPQSESFWRKNQFARTDEGDPGASPYLSMERELQ